MCGLMCWWWFESISNTLNKKRGRLQTSQGFLFLHTPLLAHTPTPTHTHTLQEEGQPPQPPQPPQDTTTAASEAEGNASENTPTGPAASPPLPRITVHVRVSLSEGGGDVWEEEVEWPLTATHLPEPDA
jgi:hypothetical protein